jgi:hypothetical protein
MFPAGSHGGAAGDGRDDAPGCVTRTNATADAPSRYHGRPGKHGKITQKFVPALSTSNPPGHQRATATGRRADPAQPHGPDALRNVMDHLRPGAPVAAGGGKWAAPWMVAVNLQARMLHGPYVRSFEGFGRP